MKTKVLLFLIALFAATTDEISAQNVVNIKSNDVSGFLKKNKTVTILDVRTPEEFNSGHLEGAINIDIRNQDAVNKINALNKEAKYLVYCRTSNRSGAITDYMVKNGFKDVTKMENGIVGWNANQYPLVK